GGRGRSISRARRPALGRGRKQLLRATTANTEAHDLYLRGRYFWNDRSDAGLKHAIDLYEKAIELDPGYGRAHAALADSYLLLRNYARQRNLADLLAKARLHARSAL